MSPQSKKEYLESIHLRYKKASRKQNSIILNEFCANCSYHRKHAIRILNKLKIHSKHTIKNKGRPSIYNKPEIINPLKRIWLASNLPCSKRLKAILPLWLPFYHLEFEELQKHVTEALLKISYSTIDRLLKYTRAKYKKRGRSTTKPGTLLRKHIPIKVNQWDESRPGFIEADTVAHCGESLAGMFAYTIDTVDIATGWTEQRAVWGKGERGVVSQIHNIEYFLPFPLLGFDSDNGSEFLNHYLIRHFSDRNCPVQFTRSRPYHKDDNSHVEQKNWTHVRQWFGYHRLDNPAVVDLMNDLYCREWRLFHNFFCPSVKLLSKKELLQKLLNATITPRRLIKES